MHYGVTLFVCGVSEVSYQAETCICATSETHDCVGDYCYHHLAARQRQRPINEAWNLLNVCAALHLEIHTKGLNSAALKHPEIERFLIENDWHSNGYKWIHPKDTRFKRGYNGR